EILPRLDAGVDVVLELVRVEIENAQVRVGSFQEGERFIAQVLQHDGAPLLAGDVAEEVPAGGVRVQKVSAQRCRISRRYRHVVVEAGFDRELLEDSRNT